MVNLLPQKTQKRLLALYVAHLAGSVFFVLGIVFLIGGGLLVPSYFSAKSDADAAQQYQLSSQQAADIQGGQAKEKTLAIFTERVSVLASYEHDAVVAKVLSSLTKSIPKGVNLSTISYTSDQSAGNSISIEGNAATRDALLAYIALLQQDPLFTGVEIPLANLGSDINVPFSLSFMLAPQKS